MLTVVAVAVLISVTTDMSPTGAFVVTLIFFGALLQCRVQLGIFILLQALAHVCCLLLLAVRHGDVHGRAASP